MPRPCCLAGLLFIVSCVLWSAGVARANPGVDVSLLSEWVVPLANDEVRVNRYRASLSAAAAAASRCRQAPVALVLDAGLGQTTLLALETLPVRTRVISFVPHDAQLSAAVRMTVSRSAASDGFLARLQLPGTFSALAAALTSSSSGGECATIVVFDWLPKHAAHGASMLSTLARLFGAGALAEGAVSLIPEAARFRGALLVAPAVRALVELDSDKQGGADLRAAFAAAGGDKGGPPPPPPLPSSKWWAKHRPLSTHELLSLEERRHFASAAEEREGAAPPPTVCLGAVEADRSSKEALVHPCGGGSGSSNGTRSSQLFADGTSGSPVPLLWKLDRLAAASAPFSLAAGGGASAFSSMRPLSLGSISLQRKPPAAPLEGGGCAGGSQQSYDALAIWVELHFRDASGTSVLEFELGGGPDGAHYPHLSDVVIPIGRQMDAAFTCADNSSSARSPRIELVLGPDFVVSGRAIWGGSADAAGDRDDGAEDAAASAAFPTWHISMLNDGRRNAAYGGAIRGALAAIAAGSEGRQQEGAPVIHALELGAGAGLLSIFAARAGATSVSAVEADGSMVPRLRAAVRANGVGDVVRVVPFHSTALPSLCCRGGACGAFNERDASCAPQSTPQQQRRAPPRGGERADVLIHEIFDFTLTGEGVLPSVKDALERLVRQDPPPVVLPARVAVYGALVESGALARQFIAPPLLDGARAVPLRDVAHPIVLDGMRHTLLSRAFKLYTLDFSKGPAALDIGAPGDAFGPRVSALVRKRGGLHAIVTWFVLDFGAFSGNSSEGGGGPLLFSTAPKEMDWISTHHWYQSAQILSGARVKAGQKVVLQPTVVIGSGGHLSIRVAVVP